MVVRSRVTSERPRRAASSRSLASPINIAVQSPVQTAVRPPSTWLKLKSAGDAICLHDSPIATTLADESLERERGSAEGLAGAENLALGSRRRLAAERLRA